MNVVLLNLTVFFLVVIWYVYVFCFFFFFQAEDGIRDRNVTGVQTCALPICSSWRWRTRCRPITPTTWAGPTGSPAACRAKRSGRGSPCEENCDACRVPAVRSEERRVGKECRCRWARYQ